MADVPVTECEQEVELARAKLASDLAMLRSPSTYNAFTDDLRKEKDALVDKARSAAQSTLSNMVEDIKARAAANPSTCRSRTAPSGKTGWAFWESTLK